MDFQNRVVDEDEWVEEEERLMYSEYIITPVIQEAA
jgi:hypothetical protein